MRAHATHTHTHTHTRTHAQHACTTHTGTHTQAQRACTTHTGTHTHTHAVTRAYTHSMAITCMHMCTTIRPHTQIGVCLSSHTPHSHVLPARAQAVHHRLTTHVLLMCPLAAPAPKHPNAAAASYSGPSAGLPLPEACLPPALLGVPYVSQQLVWRTPLHGAHALLGARPCIVRTRLVWRTPLHSTCVINRLRSWWPPPCSEKLAYFVHAHA